MSTQDRDCRLHCYGRSLFAQSSSLTIEAERNFKEQLRNRLQAVTLNFRAAHSCRPVFDTLPAELLTLIALEVGRVADAEDSNDGSISPDLLKFRCLSRRFASCGNRVYIALCAKAPSRYRVLRLSPYRLSLAQLHDALCKTTAASSPVERFATVVDAIELRLYCVATRRDLGRAVEEQATKYHRPQAHVLEETVSSNVAAFNALHTQQTSFMQEISSEEGKAQLRRIFKGLCLLKVISVTTENFWHLDMAAHLDQDKRCQIFHWNFLPKMFPVFAELRVPQLNHAFQPGYGTALNKATLNESFLATPLANALCRFELKIEQNYYRSWSYQDRSDEWQGLPLSPEWHILSAMKYHTMLSCLSNLEVLAISLSGNCCEDGQWLTLLKGLQLPSLRCLSLSRFQMGNSSITQFLTAHASTLKELRMDGCGMVSHQATLDLLHTIRLRLALGICHLTTLHLSRSRRESMPDELQKILHDYCEPEEAEFVHRYRVAPEHLVDYLMGLGVGECTKEARQHEREAWQYAEQFMAL